jgi:hypothetical protein
MKHHFLASFLALSVASAAAQDIHLVSPGTTVRASLSPASLNQRVEAAAKQYEQYAPVPRFGVYDVAYPRDVAESAATGGFGVALVVIYSQKAAELPLRRLLLRTAGNTVELELISSASSDVEGASNANRVFGKNRWEGLYVFPAYQQQAGSELVADFQINRSGFILARFSATGTAQTPGAEGGNPAASAAKRAALSALIEREYPGFVIRATASAEHTPKSK